MKWVRHDGNVVVCFVRLSQRVSPVLKFNDRPHLVMTDPLFSSSSRIPVALVDGRMRDIFYRYTILLIEFCCFQIDYSVLILAKWIYLAFCYFIFIYFPTWNTLVVLVRCPADGSGIPLVETSHMCLLHRVLLMLKCLSRPLSSWYIFLLELCLNICFTWTLCDLSGWPLYYYVIGKMYS